MPTTSSSKKHQISFIVFMVIGGVFLMITLVSVASIKSQRVALSGPQYVTPSTNSQIPTAATVSGQTTDPAIISGSFDPAKFKTDAQWHQLLSQMQYQIMRQGGTETPFTGALLHEDRKGTFYSIGCDVPLFRSEQKYDSGTGWPSFTAPISADAVVLKKDDSIPFAPRLEVLDKCGSHLGHVFDDGPAPTGKRYCMNSAALSFVPDAK